MQDYPGSSASPHRRGVVFPSRRQHSVASPRKPFPPRSIAPAALQPLPSKANPSPAFFRRCPACGLGLTASFRTSLSVANRLIRPAGLAPAWLRRFHGALWRKRAESALRVDYLTLSTPHCGQRNPKRDTYRKPKTKCSKLIRQICLFQPMTTSHSFRFVRE